MRSRVSTIDRTMGAVSRAMGFVLLLLLPRIGETQEHVHEAPAAPNAMTRLLLEGPHLVLYHRGLLQLTEPQQVGLQRLRRSLCSAEVEFVRQRDEGRARVGTAVADTTGPARTATTLRAALNDVAAAESQWLATLVQSRRDAIAILTPPQRAQLVALRDHWARETTAMIDEATRPGQRGHPGMQIPIRVPGMVVGETTLLPYCEALHGPTMHIVIPPPR
ncbi:MAG: hypothetical protein IPK85_22865 [Gemmatimonadetes bacterium]|nr:hypothetical protein [Gemmatimonadota bacterium]